MMTQRKQRNNGEVQPIHDVKRFVDTRPLSTLFLQQFGANAGYARGPLERAFYEVGLELAQGDSRLLHFGYPDFDKGRPRDLPEDFDNLLTYNLKDRSRQNIATLADYARKNHIDLCVIADIQPAHPIFRPLHAAGVRAVIAYWGATICSLMPRWRLAIKKLRLALSRSKVDGLIFQSQAMADLAIYGRGVPRSMLDVVPLGVDTALYKPDRTTYVHDALGLPRDRKVVIYSGHMEARKGVRTLVEAAIELLVRRNRSDVCFLICGNREGENRRFEELYAGMGIEHLIRFGGYRRDLPQIYPSCFCGVIPSTGWDSYPRSSIEMAACGLPVVASRLQGLCEAVLDGETGLLFEPGNSRELADRLQSLLDNPNRAAEYGANGRKRCEQELSLARQHERLLSVFRKRLQQGRGLKS
jgi:glycosyltransferase involved in cell wall biosynthesis